MQWPGVERGNVTFPGTPLLLVEAGEWAGGPVTGNKPAEACAAQSRKPAVGFHPSLGRAVSRA